MNELEKLKQELIIARNNLVNMCLELDVDAEFIKIFEIDKKNIKNNQIQGGAKKWKQRINLVWFAHKKILIT